MEFKISSALKDLIGRELITNDLVAIFELVKNSYDAGASNVKIIFDNIKENNSKAGRILLIDDGSGMSKEDIEKKWLFLGFSEKKFAEKELEDDFRDKIQTRRIYAGAKGIGRFSCDRLGSNLKIYTKKSSYSYLNIEWNKFEEDQNKEFQNIPFYYEENVSKKFPFEIENTGTILEISKLRDVWDYKKLQQLKRYLQRLLNPVQVNDDSFKISLEAKEFLDRDKKEKCDYNIVNSLIENVVYEKLKIKTTMIQCEISNDGKEIYTKLEDKGNFIFEFKEKNVFSELKNINVKLSYLNAIAKSTFTKLMGIEPRNYGSLFLFKNGFRILPYGEYGDDWLGLDARKTQGYARFLGNRDVLGRIEINGNQPNFREVTSRSEGLVKTNAFYELQDFIIEKIIKVLEKYVVDAIDWDSPRDTSERGKKEDTDIKKDTLALIQKLTGDSSKEDVNYNQDFFKIIEEKQVEKIPQTIKNLEQQISKEKDPERKEEQEKNLKALKTGLKLQEQKTKKEKEELIQNKKEIETQNLFLKSVHAQSYEQIISYHHHILTHSLTINNFINKIIKESSNEKPDIKKINEKVQKINYLNNQIYTISNIAAKGGVTESINEREVDLISFFYEYLENICRKYVDGVQINISDRPKKEFKKRIKPFEMTYLIDNFISNSSKAKASQINFNFEITNDELKIIITDNGNGLNKSITNIDSIFEPGITTTRGSGLGLYDVRNILNKISSSIRAETFNNKELRFLISIKK